uniref:Formylglycine-generating enzyme family protein n=1 Tax=Caldilinea aerophila TaxID=133453 RepID=A0A7C1JY34_9CHLR
MVQRERLKQKPRIFVAMLFIGGVLVFLGLVGHFISSPAVAESGQEAESILYLPLIQKPFTAWLPLVYTVSPVYNEWPPTGAQGQSVNLFLSWQLHPSVAPQSGLRYEVYLDAHRSVPETLVASTAIPFYTPAPLQLNTTYSWQVVVVTANDARLKGPVWNFSTEVDTFPPDIEAMVYIPEGEFLMGCDSRNPWEISCFPEEVPLHRVYLDAYYIDKYEVTNLEYRRCVEAGVCNPPRRYNSRRVENYFINSAYDYYPVLYVSWWDGQTYCAWEGKRLPTEAQWEKAARGPNSTRVYPWGNEHNYSCDRAAKRPDNSHCFDPIDMQQVGFYPLGASPYGLMDMAGNAFEWTQDLYDMKYYYSSPYENPPGSDHVDHDWGAGAHYKGPLFTIRGGSNMDNWYYMRTAHRHYGHHSDPETELFDAPYFRSWRVGFRCAVLAAEWEAD